MINIPYLKTIHFLLLLTAVVALVPFSASATKAKIDRSNLISISVKQSDISELFEMLSRQNNVNILLANGVDGEVSINLYDISVKDAIYSIASAAGLAVERMGNGYLITKQTDVGKTIPGGLTDLRTYKIQYSDSKQVAEILENQLSQYGKIDILDQRNILVIEDLPDFLDHIEKLLQQLDQAPSQILIEARIFTVTLDDTQKYGLDWSKTFSANGGTGNIGVENLGKQVLDLAIGSAAGPAGLFFNYFNKNIEVQLNLLSRKGRLRALATPSLLALEHQEAEVIIGKRTGYKVTTTINQVTTESIEFLESGVILKVTPSIDRFGRIMMDIHPEVSDTKLNDGIPTLSTTEVNTQLLVEDGQTVFIGGLIENGVTNNHQGVPFLEDIPFLGYLFTKEDEFSINTETIVMIKPQIIHSHNINLLTNPDLKIEQFKQSLKKETEVIDGFFEKSLFHKTTEPTVIINPDTP